MTVLALGLSHHTAPLDLRARFAVPADRMGPALASLRERLHWPQAECALLSTCNRTELYIAHGGSAGGAAAAGHAANDPSPLPAPGTDALLGAAVGWLGQWGQAPAAELSPHVYANAGPAAARHAFRVAAGLDSMVLGEAQILGQMKQAVRLAEEAGTLGTTLHALFQRSFSVAKAVRTSTEIGAHSVSMAAAAVRLAEQLFERLADTRVLFVGAGEMVALTAMHFAGRRPQHITVANRSAERGLALAQQVGGHTLALAEVPARLHEFDVVVSGTASTLPIIGLGAVETAIRRRRRRPMLMVDLAVPRDIEPEVAGLEDVYLHSVDDLAAIVLAGGASRRAAVVQAEAIVDAGVSDFARWLSQRAMVPLIQAVQSQAELWRADAMSKALRRLTNGEDPQAVMEGLSRMLSSRMMHGVLAGLNDPDTESRQHMAEAAARCFLGASRSSNVSS